MHLHLDSSSSIIHVYSFVIFCMHLSILNHFPIIYINILVGGLEHFSFFPTCQVRVVRFYVSCLLLLPRPPLLLLLVLLVLLLLHCDPCQCALPDLNHDHPRQCALPDLNHDHPRPVFPAGPQPRPSRPSVPCRTSTASIHAKCSLPDLM